MHAKRASASPVREQAPDSPGQARRPPKEAAPEPSEGATLFYLYGIVRAASAPSPGAVAGLDGGIVRVVPAAGLGALVSEVRASEYDEEALDGKLEDVSWVGERAVAHERVLSWYAGQGPVVPLSPFSFHRDEARVRARVEAMAPRLERLLDDLAGKHEWGVKVWREDAVLFERLEGLSSALEALAREIAAAGQGRRFLLEKKREALRVNEAARVSRQVASDVFSGLRELAERAVVLPIPAAPPAADGGAAQRLVLHSSFLIAEAGFDLFHMRLNEVAGELGQSGFSFELAGPLPPYHFARVS